MTCVIYSVSSICLYSEHTRSHAWILEKIQICEGEHVLGVIPRLPNEQEINPAP